MIENSWTELIYGSTYILDSQTFYSSLDNREEDKKVIYPNNYEENDIRSFINDDFYNSAFSEDEQEK